MNVVNHLHLNASMSIETLVTPLKHLLASLLKLLNVELELIGSKETMVDALLLDTISKSTLVQVLIDLRNTQIMVVVIFSRFRLAKLAWKDSNVHHSTWELAIQFKWEHLLLTKLEDLHLHKFTMVKILSECLISQELLLNPLHTERTKLDSLLLGPDLMPKIALMYSAVLIITFLLRCKIVDGQILLYLKTEELTLHKEPDDILAILRLATIVDAVLNLRQKLSLLLMFLLNHRLLSTHLLPALSELIGNSDLMEVHQLTEFL